jgi:hypothetical protein
MRRGWICEKTLFELYDYDGWEVEHVLSPSTPSFPFSFFLSMLDGGWMALEVSNGPAQIDTQVYGRLFMIFLFSSFCRTWVGIEVCKKNGNVSFVFVLVYLGGGIMLGVRGCISQHGYCHDHNRDISAVVFVVLSAASQMKQRWKCHMCR